MNLVQAIREALAANGSDTAVAPESMLRLAPMWYAVNRICSHVGQLPVDLKRAMKPRGAETLSNDPRWKLLRTRPNGYQTPAVFKEQLTAHMLMFGDGRAYVARRGSRVVELIPLNPYRTTTGLVMGEKMHLTVVDEHDRITRYETPDNQKRVALHDSEVVHLPNLSIDGVNGQRMFDVARETIRTGLAADKRTSKGMTNGFAGKVMLEAPKGAFRQEDHAKEFLKDFREEHAKADGESVGLLINDVKAHVLEMSNHDAQFIEQRAYMRQEAALWFLLETIVGDDDSVSYNSLEQKTLAYLSSTLDRWLVRWEQELDLKLLSESEQAAMYFKVNTGPLLRSDLPSTISALAEAVQNRIFNPNEARDKLDINPYEGGDVYENPAISPGPPGSSTSGKPGDQSGKGGTSGDRAQSRVFSAAEAVQKVYLGVGKVVTSDEARAIVNAEADAGLAIPGPEFAAANSGESGGGFARAAVVSRIQHMLGTEQTRVDAMLKSEAPMQKIEGFYTRWQPTLAAVVAELGGDPSLAEEHCHAAIEVLIAGKRLKPASERAEALADSIMGALV